MTTPTTVNAGADRWQVLRLLVARKTVLISLIVLVVLVAAALLAPWVSPYDPFKLSIMNRLKAPGAVHWFGTDDFGRDVFSRCLLYTSGSCRGCRGRRCRLRNGSTACGR